MTLTITPITLRINNTGKSISLQMTSSGKYLVSLFVRFERFVVVERGGAKHRCAGTW